MGTEGVAERTLEPEGSQIPRNLTNIMVWEAWKLKTHINIWYLWLFWSVNTKNTQKHMVFLLFWVLKGLVYVWRRRQRWSREDLEVEGFKISPNLINTKIWEAWKLQALKKTNFLTCSMF